MTKEKYFGAGKVFRNAATVLKQKNNFKLLIIASGAFAFLYLFFYGVYEIPFLELGILKMTPFSVFDGIYVAAASVLTGMIIVLFKHNRSRGARGLMGGGILGSAFGIFCPACLGTNLLLFGNVISLTVVWIVPYLWIIQLLSLAALAAGFWFSAKAATCTTCIQLPFRKHPAADSGLKFTGFHNKLLTLFIMITAVFIVFQMLPSQTTLTSATASSVTGETDMDRIIANVLPEEGFTLDAEWNGVVKNMVDEGVLDPAKLENILVNRYGQQMKPEW